MVTGKKPFVEDEKRSAMHKIRLEKHVGARKLNPEIPRELERIIDKSLEKQPRDRWRSAQHMVMALERFLAKHVEINHHARLVLFMRSQNVITELEAEEYLHPQALGGEKGGALPNMQARHAVRTGVLAHAVALSFLLLVLGLIHVAPLGATPHSQGVASAKEAGTGTLQVNVIPWASVQLDGKEIAETPIANPVPLREGSYTLKLVHEGFQPLEKTVKITAGETSRLDVDLCKEGKPKGALEGCGSAP